LRVGAVGEPGRFPAESLATLFDIEIAWQARTLDVEQFSARQVDAILFNVETTDALSLVQLFDRVRSLRPKVRILVSVGWRGNVLAVCEMRSYRVLPNRYVRRLGLTPRESQVLEKVRAGETNHEIAVDLGTSVSTVNRHVENILRKLHARNRAEAAASAPEFSL
jgi:DNA-binding CsgD family transcriptional regulator